MWLFSPLRLSAHWITYGSGKDVQHMPAHVVASSLCPSKESALQCSTPWQGPTQFHSSATVERSLHRMFRTSFPSWPQFYALWRLHQRWSRKNHLLSWKGLWYFSMTEQAVYWKSTLDNITPTKAALEQQIRRAVLLGDRTWGNSLVPACTS